MKWYVKCLKNYTNFSGRARRKEYWMFILFHYSIIFSLFILTIIASETFSSSNEMDGPSIMILSLLSFYIIASIIPYLAVTIRRLHDINKSGAYWFVRFIPLAGPIWLLILLVEDSWDASNKYGPNPKGFQDDIINRIGKE